ncbi:hypothetical protein TNCV_2861191 [Trichonephila clavipes]|nr:hypothetical protein TNCV_2861191 [Trichonephila clavipes]
MIARSQAVVFFVSQRIRDSRGSDYRNGQSCPSACCMYFCGQRSAAAHLLIQSTASSNLPRKAVTSYFVLHIFLVNHGSYNPPNTFLYLQPQRKIKPRKFRTVFPFYVTIAKGPRLLKRRVTKKARGMTECFLQASRLWSTTPLSNGASVFHRFV